MREQKDLTQAIDWTTVFIYLAMVTLGWFNIYAAVYDPETDRSIFDFGLNSGKQLIWIFSAFLIIVVFMLIDFKFYDKFAYPTYIAVMLALIFVLFFGKEVAGSRSWFSLGFIRIQPAEFSKFATCLALAKFLQDPSKKIERFSVLSQAILLILLPMALIILQGDTGSAIVFGSLILMFYREGLPSFWVVLILLLIVLFVGTLFLRENYLYHLVGGISALGIIIMALLLRKGRVKFAFLILFAAIVASGLILSVDFIIQDVMKPHQQRRIETLINPNFDPMGAGWQVTQSKIAIGSGGFTGKGFLKGTQTKFDFVPDQSTDFIFCTVGEEHGWAGSLLVIILFTALIYKVTSIAERQKSRFSRVYGYCVASIFMFHFMINIGMTIGLFPVIGIPLPFFSYGGSSLWSFTILLFILLKLDAHRMQILAR